MRVSGIYKIQSKIKPERVYIGSAVNVHDRKVRHLWDMKKNVHANSKLQRHYNKYGKDDLHFELILACDESELIEKEQFFIDSYNPYFNLCPIAGNCRGRHMSDATRKKLSEANKGRPSYIKGKKRPPEEIAKMRGRKWSEESRAKLRESCKKRPPISEETREKMRQSHIGIKLSDEAKAKVSAASKGRTLSPETKEALRKANLGRKASDETKRKLRESHVGIKPTQEALKKIGDALRGKKRPRHVIEAVRNSKYKPLLQYTLDMAFIREWGNSVIASETLIITKSAINKAARGERKQAGGFIWRYKEQRGAA